MVEHKFSSISNLSKYLQVSRTTLYKRAKEHNITLSGVYSDEQLKKLSGVQQLNTKTEQVEQLNGHIEQKSEHFKQEITFLKKQLSDQNKYVDFIINQLKEKDSQIGLLNKNLDQAQQLQLIAEQRLTETKSTLIEYQKQEKNTKKGFWNKLFG
ncbi:replication initiation protein [Leuconostoc falkenbergense]|uniref:replication initiation protein n=1 Tax=Leuconostoc falkenbergense TaxID=2766470 RepID=UPI0024A8919B|nr:replication initiation protein [Leuconostoc falkenbergense]MDI6554188.1 replication initiation protein [Leuconostoc falkenbergense]